MKSQWIVKLMILVAVVVSFSLLLGWNAERKPMVSSEPIRCFESGDDLVCFESLPSGPQACERVDLNTVICQ